ncbi:TPA: hypothetical protein MIH39_22350 [Klebsiella pneumoniae]|nr:hypothetical protein [Escherichia coli]HBX8145575.1 hypothetical protein [Klebsiella pneumoniae]
MLNIILSMILCTVHNYHITYRFPAAQIRFLADSDLYAALTIKLVERLPAEVLTLLPEWGNILIFWGCRGSEIS